MGFMCRDVIVRGVRVIRVVVFINFLLCVSRFVLMLASLIVDFVSDFVNLCYFFFGRSMEVEKGGLF